MRRQALQQARQPEKLSRADELARLKVTFMTLNNHPAES
jgi:hypothetical protein